MRCCTLSSHYQAPFSRSPLLSSLTIQTPSACTQVLHHRRGTWLLSWWQKKRYSPETAVPTMQHCNPQSHPGRGKPGRGCPVPAGHASQAERVAQRGACQVRMRAESLVRNRALLREAKELVFPKWSCSAGRAVRCLPCNLQHLDPSHSIPPRFPRHHPSTRPTFCLLRFQEVQLLAAAGRSFLPAAGGAWAPASPALGFVLWVAQGALRMPRPRGSQSHPPLRRLWLLHASASAGKQPLAGQPLGGVFGLSTERRVPARGSSEVCSCLAERPFPLLEGSTGFGVSPIREQM